MSVSPSKTIPCFLLPLHILPLTCLAAAVQANFTALFPSVLIFGDSTVDTGNNNYINTIFRCSNLPYGESFPGGSPTGRCSNGKLPPDLLVEFLGLKETVPPFLNPNLSDEDVVTGVCFASAGSGYDDHTPAISNVIPMTRQLMYFRQYIRRLEGIVGKKEARGYVNAALVLVSAATNDIILSFPTRRLQMTIELYHDFLLTELRKFVKELYYLGCRNILVVGLPPVGCLPVQKTLNGQFSIGCIDEQNEESESYNEKLRENILPQLQANLPNSKLVYGDIFTPLLDLINTPQKYELAETGRGCCGSGILEIGPLCTQRTPICQNPNQYLFFDSIHPTEAGYKALTQNLIQINLPKFV